MLTSEQFSRACEKKELVSQLLTLSEHSIDDLKRTVGTDSGFQFIGQGHWNQREFNMNAKADANPTNRTYNRSFDWRIVLKPMPATAYDGIQCQYRRCRKMIALRLFKANKRSHPQSVSRFNPFVVRCPHCMRYQLCESRRVQVFEGPPPEPTFRDHPKFL
jgi:hypothetical protein